MTIVRELRGKTFVQSTKSGERVYFLPNVKQLPLGIVYSRAKNYEDSTSGDILGVTFSIPDQPEISILMESLEEKAVDEEWFAKDDSKLSDQVEEFCKAIDRVMTSYSGFESFLIGLCGEIYLLNSVLSGLSTDAQKISWIKSWKGFDNTSRDFIGGKIAVEVKTTKRSESCHMISNINQTSLTDTEGGKIEKLFLASISLNFDNDAKSLPKLVAELLTLLPSGVNEDEILTTISTYGGTEGPGYIHSVHKDYEAFKLICFSVDFLRIYDMGDTRIKVPRMTDISDFEHLNKSNIKFEINLPGVFVGTPKNPLDVSDLVASYPEP
jgi:hypothetical protein